MTYQEARVYLDEMSKYGSVLGLDTIRELLRELHDPQKDLQFVHIAGTNGKGSVLAYTSTILSEAGYRTGRYVSPTVVSYLERIQVDGIWISEAEFAAFIEDIKKAIARMETNGGRPPTVFEIETAVAFLYFKKKKCDIVVLETGLGGLMDATNVVEHTLIAAFASISLDHMGFLGETLTEIAENKAGIIKPGCTVITGVQELHVQKVLEKKATQYSCPLKMPVKTRAVKEKDSYLGQTFSYGDMEHLEIALAGEHQMENALVALTIIEELNRKDFHITKDHIRAGLLHTRWQGRFTCIRKSPVFIIDGAHNEDAAKRLKTAVQKYFTGRRLIYIMGVFKDKEYEKIAAQMAPMAAVVYTIDLPDENRTLSAVELQKVVLPYCKQTYVAESVEDAVERALMQAGENDVILAFGSLSYLGRVLKKLTISPKGENDD
ncbi:MAG: folylpolyglutamate synthase/dihydrofolate synthase family protein [Lachnospiraceae bacterium]